LKRLVNEELSRADPSESDPLPHPADRIGSEEEINLIL